MAGEATYNFESIVEFVEKQGRAGEPVVMGVERNGKAVELTVKPESKELEDPLTHASIQRYLIGFAPRTLLYPAEMTTFKIRSFGPLIRHAASETAIMSAR